MDKGVQWRDKSVCVCEREREREKQKYLFVVEGCYVQNFRAYVAAHVTIPNPPRQQ